MKLYYSPGACSLSPHIVLREAGLPVDLVKVNLKSKVYGNDQDFKAVNGKGQVPTLELDDGLRLTEGPAIVQYLADRVPALGLVPAAGTMERYRVQEWLNFVTAELHKQFTPLFDPGSEDTLKTRMKERLAGRFDWISKQLGDKDYLMGGKFTVADAYMFVVLGWSPHVGIDLAKWPKLAAYIARIAARPAVQQALKAEGLSTH